METNNIIKIDNKQINKSITITLKNYQYEIANNQAKIIKYEGENQNVIKIPSYINYQNQIIIVNEILEGAFKDHNEIEKITIPNTIKSIHSYSFFMLSNLKLIYLPSSICFIEKNSFFLCQSLILISNLLEQPITYENNWCNNTTPIYWNISKQNILEQNNYTYIINNNTLTLISYNGKEEIVNINNKIEYQDNIYSITKIGSKAFATACQIQALNIPNNIIEIEQSSLYGLNNLKELTLPFVGKEINSQGKDSLFGNLFGLNFNKSYNIVQYYNEYNYIECSIPFSLKKVTINQGNISYGAFSNCHYLETIILKKDVKSISNNCFLNCFELIIKCEKKNINWQNNWYQNASVIYLNEQNNKITTYNKNNMQFKINNNEATLLSYNGKNKTINIPDNIIINNKNYNVTKINDNCFKNNKKIVKITLPKYLKEIGEEAFSGCENIISITLPTFTNKINDGAFYNCKSLKDVKLNDKIKKINHGLFLGCKTLKSINIPKNIQNIANDSFKGCTSLTNINVDENNNYYSSIDGNLYNKNKKELIQYAIGKKNKSFIIPKFTKKINKDALIGSNNLLSISIPSSINEISDNLINNDKTILYYINTNKLNKITKNDKLFNNKSFKNDKSFMNPIFHQLSKCNNKLYEINNIYQYKGLEYILENNKITITKCLEEKEIMEIPNVLPINNKYYPVNTIGQNSFYKCNKIKEIIMPQTIESIQNFAFYSCEKLEKIILPQSLKIINYQSFAYCIKLKRIYFNRSLTEIKKEAFLGCKSLESILLPNSLETIESCSFMSCKKMKKAYIPKSVNKIENNAFANCHNLEIYCERNIKPRDWDNKWLGEEKKVYYDIIL